MQSQSTGRQLTLLDRTILKCISAHIEISAVGEAVVTEPPDLPAQLHLRWDHSVKVFTVHALLNLKIQRDVCCTVCGSRQTARSISKQHEVTLRTVPDPLDAMAPGLDLTHPLWRSSSVHIAVCIGLKDACK
jgi:hypothetical protein